MPHLIALVSLLLVLAVPGLPSSATAAEWTIIGTGDFNGDGTTDVLWQSAADASVIDWQFSHLTAASFQVV